MCFNARRGEMKRDWKSATTAVAWPSLLVASLFMGFPAKADTCTYHTWEWNTVTRQSVNHRKVVKNKAELTEYERDPGSGCTVCEEDQIRIEMDGVPAFQICKAYAEPIRHALMEIQRSGWRVRSVSGYRVGRSRGPIDDAGLRTQFSNHSFGTAIDINAESNGLYADCIQFGPHCQLIRGGRWSPENPESITPGSVVYEMMRSIGWKWGGEIAGKQKDFMHFSLTGY